MYQVVPCGKFWTVVSDTHKMAGAYESREMAQRIADEWNAEHA